MSHREPIEVAEGGLVVEPGNLPAERTTDHLPAEQTPQPAVPAVFNPLDMAPAEFQRTIDQREENFNTLREWLRKNLKPGKDFGRIHHADKQKCPKPWECTYETNPYHYSGFQLRDPGADKILGLLGLTVVYESTEDYRRASLKGIQIQEVITRGWVVKADNPDVRITEGEGAASISEHNGAVLNNTFKKAKKRCRIDAVQRLPVVSSLFEDEDFWSSIPPDNGNFDKRPAAKAKYDTGADLHSMPFGKYKDTPFAEIESPYLEWCLTTDKPDVVRAATKELTRRGETGAIQSIQQDAQAAEPLVTEGDTSHTYTTPPRQQHTPRAKTVSVTWMLLAMIPQLKIGARGVEISR